MSEWKSHVEDLSLIVGRFILGVLVSSSVVPASGNIIYSGTQNLVLQGVPNTFQYLTIHLAGGTSSWDTLQLGVLSTELDSTGVDNIVSSAEVALASSPSDFPVVTKFDLGDPYPSDAIFGSGAKTLWSPYVSGGFTDGTGYAAVLFGTYGGGPLYSGWIQLSVQDANLPTASLTVIDWAYSDVVGETIPMGAGVPEPSESLHAGSQRCCRHRYILDAEPTETKGGRRSDRKERYRSDDGQYPFVRLAE